MQQFAATCYHSDSATRTFVLLGITAISLMQITPYQLILELSGCWQIKYNIVPYMEKIMNFCN